jgi:hypothetical protein
LANTITIKNSFVTGYRDSFYGTLEEKNVLDSDVIRSLKHYGSKMLPGTSTIVNLPVGAKRVVFAYPASLPDLVSVRDNNGLDANIINAFKKSIIQVEGCDGYWPIDYKVYVIDFANPYNTANYYTFTIGKED